MKRVFLTGARVRIFDKFGKCYDVGSVQRRDHIMRRRTDITYASARTTSLYCASRDFHTFDAAPDANAGGRSGLR
jgi:hypothetical protein